MSLCGGTSVMSDDLTFEPIEIVVSEEGEKVRIDAFLADRFEKYSRNLLRRAIVEGLITVDGNPVKPSFKLHVGHVISVRLPELPTQGPEPEDIPLDILFEDDFVIAINKPPGMVVHPARGHWSGTLASALSFHFDQLSQVAGVTRPGIVHRLDRDTSGVIIVAKTDTAHNGLASQFEARTVQKTYLAIVRGTPSRDATVVEASIGRHAYQREKMTVRDNHPTSKSARTVFYVEERFDKHSLVRAEPKTGRTHQIRVHAAHIGHPVLCDRLYGGRSQITVGELMGKRLSSPSSTVGSADTASTSNAHDTADDLVLKRHALHARRLELRHPKTDEPLCFEAPLPDDLKETLRVLRGC
jgi:23S rRNA pseudouridine1911/1915/1917 synthase